eukprot:SAG31_NODE_18184_length_644_cov_1.011009_2_plen_82_part_00
MIGIDWDELGLIGMNWDYLRKKRLVQRHSEGDIRPDDGSLCSKSVRVPPGLHDGAVRSETSVDKDVVRKGGGSAMVDSGYP